MRSISESDSKASTMPINRSFEFHFSRKYTMSQCIWKLALKAFHLQYKRNYQLEYNERVYCMWEGHPFWTYELTTKNRTKQKGVKKSSIPLHAHCGDCFQLQFFYANKIRKNEGRKCNIFWVLWLTSSP